MLVSDKGVHAKDLSFWVPSATPQASLSTGQYQGEWKGRGRGLVGEDGETRFIYGRCMYGRKRIGRSEGKGRGRGGDCDQDSGKDRGSVRGRVAAAVATGRVTVRNRVWARVPVEVRMRMVRVRMGERVRTGVGIDFLPPDALIVATGEPPS